MGPVFPGISNHDDIFSGFLSSTCQSWMKFMLCFVLFLRRQNHFVLPSNSFADLNPASVSCKNFSDSSVIDPITDCQSHANYCWSTQMTVNRNNKCDATKAFKISLKRKPSLSSFSWIFFLESEIFWRFIFPFNFFSPHPQVAIIAGNFDLAEIIKVHKASDVGEFATAIESKLVFNPFVVISHSLKESYSK